MGENEDGSYYALEKEIIETYNGISIPMFDGDNYFYLEDFTTNNLTITATYEVDNFLNRNYTSKATFEVESEKISQEINKKVGKDEIIARLNMAILGHGDDEEIPVGTEKSIIQMVSDILEIDSTNFKLTRDGTVTATAGNIAGLRMFQNAEKNSYLSKNYIDGDETYQSGLYIPNKSSGNVPFLYAGCPIDGKLIDSNLYIRHDGLIRAKRFTVNGESGYFYVNYDSERTAMTLDKSSITFYLDNEDNNLFSSLANGNLGSFLHLYDSPLFAITDANHDTGAVFIIRRFKPEDGTREYAGFNSDVYIEGNSLMDGEPHKLYVQGYEIQTTESDKRIKNNILNSEIQALELIKQIHHVSFDWDKEKAKKEGHIDCGYIAQELIKIDPNFVIYNKQFDTYQINTLYVLSTTTKAVQELSEENAKLKEKIDNLEKRLSQLENILKGEN